jgi:hypothetical protein
MEGMEVLGPPHTRQMKVSGQLHAPAALPLVPNGYMVDHRWLNNCTNPVQMTRGLVFVLPVHRTAIHNVYATFVMLMNVQTAASVV